MSYNNKNIIIIILILIVFILSIYYLTDDENKISKDNSTLLGKKQKAFIQNYMPVMVPGIPDVSRVAASGALTLALTEKNNLWVDVGSFDPARSDFRAVMAKANIKNVISVSPNSSHTTLVTADGTVWEWGDLSKLWPRLLSKVDENCITIARVYEACKVEKVLNAVSVASGGGHTLALLKNRTVIGWGANDFGQLGYKVDEYSDGDPKNVAVADIFSIPRISNITAIAAGFRSSYALKKDGTVWYWGHDAYSGFDSFTGDFPLDSWYKTAIREGMFKSQPIQIPGLKNIIAIAAGKMHALALDRDGTVWAWGASDCGALGIEPANQPLANLSEALQKIDKSQPQLRGHPYASSWVVPFPVHVKKVSDVIAIAAGDRHSLALKRDGTVWGWGALTAGQLGERLLDFGKTMSPCEREVSNDLIDSDPKKIEGIDQVVAIAASSLHSAAVKKDGTLWVWGYCLACDRSRALLNDHSIDGAK